MNNLQNNEKLTTALFIGANNIKSEEEKIKFFDNVISCEVKIDQIMGQRKKIKCAYIDKQRLEKQTGFEITNRLVFAFEDGSYCMTFSEGIFIAFKRLVAIFGEPPYNFYVTFKEVNKGKSRVYTIEISKEGEAEDETK